MALNQTIVGIIGGGQLARMLAFRSYQIGLKVRVLSEKADDPAAQVCREWVKGSPQDKKSVLSFVKTCDFVTFESEFVPKPILKSLQKLSQPNIFPSANAMALIQDRLSQKQWFDRYQISTSPWIAPRDEKDVLDFADSSNYPLVCKARIGGYDGYGTIILKSATQVRKTGLNWPDYIVESFIPFSKEVACSIVRSRKSTRLFPIVETFQENSRCLWVKGPLKEGLATTEIHKQMRKIRRALDDLDYIGVFATEFFVHGKKIYVNEVAPRVHNSCHYSQEALSLDQFESHIRAGLGQTLPKIHNRTPGFAMVNILGRKKKLGPIPTSEAGYIHWYGKKEIRPGRKMGHINTVGSSAGAALRVALKEREKVLV